MRAASARRRTGRGHVAAPEGFGLGARSLSVITLPSVLGAGGEKAEGCLLPPRRRKDRRFLPRSQAAPSHLNPFLTYIYIFTYRNIHILHSIYCNLYIALYTLQNIRIWRFYCVSRRKAAVKNLRDGGRKTNRRITERLTERNL